ncbi:MAG: hypothetical protein GY696_28015 [Gammaproteobacteria bacterium]|nr:hypothetical protein [Gammaproteobacteria bacterium]
MANPIPNIVLHPHTVGTTNSTDFQGPIARHVSDDFGHFFTQMATECDVEPIPTVAEYSRLAGTADSTDFRGPIARPVSDGFRHFSLKSPPNMMLTPSQQWHLAGDSPYARSTSFYHLFTHKR